MRLPARCGTRSGRFAPNLEGIWVDGSCFNKVIPTLQADWHQVIAAQYDLDTPGGDVAAVKCTLGRGINFVLLGNHLQGNACRLGGVWAHHDVKRSRFHHPIHVQVVETQVRRGQSEFNRPRLARF